MKKGNANESYSLPINNINNTINVVGENILLVIPVDDNQQPIPSKYLQIEKNVCF